MASRSRSTSVTVRSWGRATRWARLPASGLASTAITRSPRSIAKVLPRASAMVVLPTPPLRLITTTRREPSIGVRSRRSSSCRRCSVGAGPGVDHVPGAVVDRAPPARLRRRDARRRASLVGEVCRGERRVGSRDGVEGSGFVVAMVLLLRLVSGAQRRPVAVAAASPRAARARRRCRPAARGSGRSRRRPAPSRPSSRRPGHVEDQLLQPRSRPGRGSRTRADAQRNQPNAPASSGTTIRTQAVTTRRARGRSSVTRGSAGWPGRRLRSTGPTRAKRSGTPARSERT